METPREVKEALAAKHPWVGCYWSPERKRFRLVVFWAGRYTHLRWITRRRMLTKVFPDGRQEREMEPVPQADGPFVWPDLYNTVEWLNQTDSWGATGGQEAKLMSMALEDYNQRHRKLRVARSSDMVRNGLAPEIRWHMNKALK